MKTETVFLDGYDLNLDFLLLYFTSSDGSNLTKLVNYYSTCICTCFKFSDWLL